MKVVAILTGQSSSSRIPTIMRRQPELFFRGIEQLRSRAAKIFKESPNILGSLVSGGGGQAGGGQVVAAGDQGDARGARDANKQAAAEVDDSIVIKASANIALQKTSSTPLLFLCAKIANLTGFDTHKIFLVCQIACWWA